MTPVGQAFMRDFLGEDQPPFDHTYLADYVFCDRVKVALPQNASSEEHRGPHIALLNPFFSFNARRASSLPGVFHEWTEITIPKILSRVVQPF